MWNNTDQCDIGTITFSSQSKVSTDVIVHFFKLPMALGAIIKYTLFDWQMTLHFVWDIKAILNFSYQAWFALWNQVLLLRTSAFLCDVPCALGLTIHRHCRLAFQLCNWLYEAKVANHLCKSCVQFEVVRIKRLLSGRNDSVLCPMEILTTFFCCGPFKNWNFKFMNLHIHLNSNFCLHKL